MPELPDITLYLDALQRMGKRIVIGLEDDLFLVLHLMVAAIAAGLAEDAGRTGRGPVGGTARRLPPGDQAWSSYCSGDKSPGAARPC